MVRGTTVAFIVERTNSVRVQLTYPSHLRSDERERESRKRDDCSRHNILTRTARAALATTRRAGRRAFASITAALMAVTPKAISRGSHARFAIDSLRSKRKNVEVSGASFSATLSTSFSRGDASERVWSRDNYLAFSTTIRSIICVNTHGLVFLDKIPHRTISVERCQLAECLQRRSRVTMLRRMENGRRIDRARVDS